MQKTSYNIPIKYQDIDFTQQLSWSKLIDQILMVADMDATAHGWGVEMLNANNLTWVLSKIAVEVEDRAKVTDTLTITTWVSEIGRVITTRNFEIKDQNGNHLASAISQWCLIDLTTRSLGSLGSISAIYKEYILNESPAIEKPIKINTANTQLIEKHKARYSDLDFNQHVNTLRYLDMMLDNTPLEKLKKRNLQRIDLHFVSESLYGDILEIKQEIKEEYTLFEISKENGTVSVRGALKWRG